MGVMDDAETIHPKSASAWGRWLGEHHRRDGGVWVRIDDRTAQGDDALSYENAVLEALCWGWIDATARSKGLEGSVIWFSPRRASSPWAASNKARILRLEAEGRMQPAGRALIEAARANGMWSVLEGPEAGIEPPWLTTGLDADPAARAFWDGLPPSTRKTALTAVALAKQDATKASRIQKIVEDCAAGRRPA